MKIKTSSLNLVVRSMVDSLSADIMQQFARMLMEGYDLHDQTGIPENIPIQKKQAAEHIMADIKKRNLTFLAITVPSVIASLFGLVIL